MLSLTKVAGGTSPRRCKAASGKIEVCADSYGNNGWLGLAQIWISGGHITKAVAKMNDFYFNFATYNTPAWRQLVMCQEIGHDFGLGHQETEPATSCMGSGQQPNWHDYDQLATIYVHLDEDSSDDGGDTKPCRGGPKKCRGRPKKCGGGPKKCGGARAQPPPTAFDMELPNSGQWGRAIAVSRDGGQSVFVQDFGNGYQGYTHVTWTLEIAETLRQR